MASYRVVLGHCDNAASGHLGANGAADDPSDVP